VLNVFGSHESQNVVRDYGLPAGDPVFTDVMAQLGGCDCEALGVPFR